MAFIAISYMSVTFLNEKAISLIPHYGILEKLVTFIAQIKMRIEK